MTYERDPQKVEILVQELLKRTIENHNSYWGYEVDQNTGEVDVKGQIVMDHSLTGNFPFKFRTVVGSMTFRHCEMTSLVGAPDHVTGSFVFAYNSTLKTLRGLPRRIGKMLSCVDIKTLKEIPPYEWRYALISNINGFYFPDGNTFIEDLHEILQYGRVGNIMPSELIPGKIAQLKELKYKGKRK